LVTDTLWVLPTCDPSYTDAQNTANPARAAASDLCLIFSAALLNPNNWVSEPKGETAGDVEYQLESIREPGIEAADRGVVFTFYPYNDIPSGDLDDQVTWRTDGVHENALMITPGTYEYRQWGFTKPGTYVFQLHVKGHPRNHDVHGAVIDTSISKDSTNTSEVIRYTFHVGLLAELNTRLSVDNNAPEVGDEVEITIKARNEGPAAGNDVKVQVNLPDGLEYVSSTADVGSYDNSTGVWSVGDMDAPTGGAAATVTTLTITATVEEGTRGDPLEVTVSIGGTETIGGSKVTELDPHGEEVHHGSTLVITPVATTNAPAELYLELSVPENSVAGTTIGNKISVRGDDPGDELTYTLYNKTGHGFSLFTTREVAGGVEIVVKTGAVLDFEGHGDTVYDYELRVSDGKDHEGNEDLSIDSVIPVQINVTDDRTEPFAVRLEVSDSDPDLGDQSVVFTITLDNETPEGFDQMTWKWTESHYNPKVGGDPRVVETTGTGDPGSTRSPEEVPDAQDVVTYTLSFWHDVGGQEQELTKSNEVTVEWGITTE